MSSLIPDKTEDAVNSPSLDYRRMRDSWELLHDLLGGTPAMREARHKWLPQEPREQTKSYDNRLRRSFLFNAFGDTIEKLTAKPFSRPVIAQGELPEPIDQLPDDMDLAGNDLTQFCRDVFRAGMVYGLTHVLVDFPKSRAETLADERASGNRPVLIHVKPPDLIGWRTEPGPNGKERLVQIRVQEKKVEPVGEYAEEEREYVRVITDTEWQLWRKSTKEATPQSGEKWELIEEGTHSFGEVPLVTFYTNRTGFMTASPPLEDMAFLNLAHWQSLSDQRNILRFARVGLLFAAGFSDEEMEAGIAIGPNQLIRSTNENAKMGYVEHNGRAIESGQTDLRTLEERMEVMGLQPLVQSSGNQTATGKAIDESRTHSAVQAWIRSLENAMFTAFTLAARWLNLELDEEFAVDIYNDFGISMRANEDIKALIELRKVGDISHDTFLREIKRRGVLSDALDIENEIEQAKAESPLMTAIGFPADEEDDEEAEGDESADDDNAD